MSVRCPARNDAELISTIKDTKLFRGLSEKEIGYCMECSGAEIVTFRKGEMLYSVGDTPTHLPVIVKGSVTLGRYSFDGRRSILAVFDKPGDVFGYEILFHGGAKHGVCCEALTSCTTLMMPQKFLVQTCDRNCGFHSTLISNMMLIMADKSIELNNRIEIMSGNTLRRKIARLLLLNYEDEESVPINMGRQEMADFMNVARPSLSRELMKMQEEGLITVKGRRISIKNARALEDLLG